jgi:hypothetical protein
LKRAKGKAHSVSLYPVLQNKKLDELYSCFRISVMSTQPIKKTFPVQQMGCAAVTQPAGHVSVCDAV